MSRPWIDRRRGGFSGASTWLESGSTPDEWLLINCGWSRSHTGPNGDVRWTHRIDGTHPQARALAIVNARIGKKHYVGRRDVKSGSALVFVTDTSGQSRPLDPGPSQDVRNHSPDGFDWGYEGSGPAQLALAILLDVIGDPEQAQQHYQDFKREVIARLAEAMPWELSATWIVDWLSSRESDALARFPSLSVDPSPAPASLPPPVEEATGGSAV